MLARAVLTGGPNTGKTTTQRALRSKGFRVIDEQATEVIREGRFLPSNNPLEFRRETLARQKAAENAFAGERRLVFLDRGAYDGRAYCHATACPEPPFLEELNTGIYPIAFLFEAVPTWENDGVRYEDAGFTAVITPLMEAVYRNAGARVVRVPFMPVEDRVNLILSVLNEHGFER